MNNGYNHSTATVRVIKATTGGVCETGDNVWTVPRAAATGAGRRGGVGGVFNASIRRRAGVSHHLRAAPTATVVATAAAGTAATAASTILAAAAAIATTADIRSYPFENGTVLRHAGG